MTSNQTAKPSITLHADFRAKTTFGIATTGILLLVPISLLNILSGELFNAVAALGMAGLHTCNLVALWRGMDHQKVTLYIFLPVGMIFMAGIFLNDGLIGALWCYPTVIACYCMLSSKRAVIANIVTLAVCFPMIWLTLPEAYAYRVASTLIATSLFSGILVRVIDHQYTQLQQQLIHDPLTGLLNRLTLKQELRTAMQEHDVQNQSVSILAIDIDLFKQINDSRGHEYGDVALRRLAHFLEEHVRIEDACFRIGGEEFLILLRGMPEEQAFHAANRLRHEVELAEIVPDDPLTISVGLAAYNGNENWTNWIKRADESLYQAKRNGRNRVVIAEPVKAAQVLSLRKNRVTDSVST